MKRTLLFLLASLAFFETAHAQLAITETMPSASTNLGGATVPQGPDFWELSNFGANAIDLSGYIFNDADATRGGDADAGTLSGVTIGPGESIILVQNGTVGFSTRDDFINWWGAANVPANLQVLYYTGNGQSSSGDSIVLWSPTATSDADYVDRADFGEALRGHSFTYHPTNGVYGTISSNGVNSAFKAVISDDEGSPGTNSGPVPLVFVQQPSPTNQSAPAGQDATFTVIARGLPHPHYQWRFNGTNIDGAILSTLTLTNVQLTNAGLYSVVIANGVQSLTSSNATLTVTTSPVPPTFATAPKSADAFIGQNVQFVAQANGSPTPSFQWQLNSNNIPGANANILNLPGVQTNDAGTYTLIISSSAGTNSTSAALTVGPKPRLLITEVQSSEAAPTTGHGDWWELTSFDERPIKLLGWRLDDSSHSLAPGNAFAITNDVTIHPGESVVFVEGLTPIAFRNWWGTNLPAGLQIISYGGNGLGLSSTADEMNIWNAATLIGNELTERIAGVNFAASGAGSTFVYDPENPPVSGVFGVSSSNTVMGAAANGIFHAAQSGDFGSPGFVVASIHPTCVITNSGNVFVSWNSFATRNYTVEFKTNLDAPNWTPFVSNFTATGTSSSVTDAPDEPQKFYLI
ncbi:MAG: hypothetical protein QOD03_5, partial [Verrucomicrobiota bacterium]